MLTGKLKGNTNLQRALAERMSNWAASQEEAEVIRESEDTIAADDAELRNWKGELLGQVDEVEGTQASLTRRR